MTRAGSRYPNWVPGIELRDDWLAQVREDIVDPDREIVDPHHHLWRHGTDENPAVYEMDALWRDTGAGHKVVQTVYIECRSYWDASAPDHLKPVGETARVAQMASETPPGKAKIAAIVAHADLRGDRLDEVIDAHEAAGAGLFRGLRHSGACDPERDRLMIPGRAEPGLYADPAYRAGLARLGARGLTFDTWHYHHQNRDFLALARAVPDTTLILGHLGVPLGVARFAGQREALFEDWKKDMADIAACPNVVAKLGGFAMPDNGWGWMDNDRPPTSDEVVAAQGKWYAHMIDCFGPERCMFESNFPVDRVSLSYVVLWNAFKKMAAGLSDAEKEAVFAGTARRVYRI